MIYLLTSCEHEKKTEQIVSRNNETGFGKGGGQFSPKEHDMRSVPLRMKKINNNNK